MSPRLGWKSWLKPSSCLVSGLPGLQAYFPMSGWKKLDYKGLSKGYQLLRTPTARERNLLVLGMELQDSF